MKRHNIPVVERILSANDIIAEENRERLNKTNTFTINIMASPGAGKTSVIEATIQALRRDLRIGVIEGDIAGSLDSERMRELGIPAVQINTGGGCHLEANMIKNALAEMNLDGIDLLFIENVGNLVCPAAWNLGEHRRVLIASVPEGDDKPYKYPAMYQGVDALIINKIDLLPYIPFNMDFFKQGVELLNRPLREISTFELSCKTGEGLSTWLDWLWVEQESYRLAIRGGIIDAL